MIKSYTDNGWVTNETDVLDLRSKRSESQRLPCHGLWTTSGESRTSEIPQSSSQDQDPYAVLAASSYTSAVDIIAVFRRLGN